MNNQEIKTPARLSRIKVEIGVIEVYFWSDNWAGAVPEIVSALIEARAGMAPAYGDDNEAAAQAHYT